MEVRIVVAQALGCREKHAAEPGRIRGPRAGIGQVYEALFESGERVVQQVERVGIELAGHRPEIV